MDLKSYLMQSWLCVKVNHKCYSEDSWCNGQSRLQLYLNILGAIMPPKHSCEFPIGYYHKVKIGLTFTKMAADHTIL